MDFFTSKSIENFEVSPNNSLSNSSLEKQIESDRQKLRNLSQSIGFYHSNIDRAKAEQLLTIQYRKTRSNGIFLLRNCTTSTADYGLSIIFNEKFYHYKVQRIYNNVFSIGSFHFEKHHIFSRSFWWKIFFRQVRSNFSLEICAESSSRINQIKRLFYWKIRLAADSCEQRFTPLQNVISLK